ncbi:unnamed protein product [Prunus armeniaca]
MSTHTATDMRWHKEKQVDDDVMRHPADGEAWKEFNRTFPEFAADSRNVRLGLATDGFNPYGFPDGYASNIVRCVNVDGGKFAGLKSYDCHVFMQRLPPVGIRHLLPEDVVKSIMLLSRFFSQLTAKTLRKTNINQLRHDIVQVLCKFEMIFPPAFFTSMIHVMVHLPEEALLAGPVNYRWMYPIERLLGELKKIVRNRAKPEGSIIEA